MVRVWWIPHILREKVYIVNQELEWRKRLRASRRKNRPRRDRHRLLGNFQPLGLICRQIRNWREYIWSHYWKVMGWWQLWVRRWLRKVPGCLTWLPGILRWLVALYREIRLLRTIVWNWKPGSKWRQRLRNWRRFFELPGEPTWRRRTVRIVPSGLWGRHTWVSSAMQTSSQRQGHLQWAVCLWKGLSKLRRFSAGLPGGAISRLRVW